MSERLIIDQMKIYLTQMTEQNTSEIFIEDPRPSIQDNIGGLEKENSGVGGSSQKFERMPLPELEIDTKNQSNRSFWSDWSGIYYFCTKF